MSSLKKWWADGPVTRNFDGEQMVSGEKMLANGTVSVSVFAPSHLQDRGELPCALARSAKTARSPCLGVDQGLVLPLRSPWKKIKQKHWYQ